MTCKKSLFNISDILDKKTVSSSSSQIPGREAGNGQPSMSLIASLTPRTSSTDGAVDRLNLNRFNMDLSIPSPAFPVPFLLPGLRPGAGVSTSSSIGDSGGGGKASTSSPAVSMSTTGQFPVGMWLPQPPLPFSSHSLPTTSNPSDFSSAVAAVTSNHGFPHLPTNSTSSAVAAAAAAGVLLGGSGMGGPPFWNSAQSILAARQSPFFHRQPDFLDAIRAQYELHPALWTTLLDLKGSGRRKGGQIRFSTEQTQRLENTFEKSKYLTPQERKTIAKGLDLSERQVKTWFQNRRAKWRRVKQESPNGKFEAVSSESEDEMDV